MVHLVIKIHISGQTCAHALLNEVKEGQWVIEELGINTEVVDRQGPDRALTDIYSKGGKVLRTRRKCRKGVQRHRTDGDMAKVATTQLEEFRFRAEILWTNIRGKRYQPHERQALVDVLAPHSDVLVRLFGIDATALASEFDNVLAKLTRGLADGVSELRRLQTDTLDRVEELARDDHALGVGALIEKAFEDKDLATRRAKVMGEVFGMDLSDVGKNTALPQSLLDALSWLPGEDTDFFAPGAFSACPTLTPLPRYCDPISIPG